MKELFVFYDADCGLCTTFRRWLEGEEALVPLHLVPLASSEAQRLCPGLLARGAAKEMIVLADDGRLWQGEAAWVTCLWALKRWRKWAIRFARPALLPLARRICHLVSAHRLTLSKLLLLKCDRDVLEEVRVLDGGSGAVGHALREVVKRRDEGRGE